MLLQQHETFAAEPASELSTLTQALNRVVAKRRSVYSYQARPVPRNLVDLAVKQALQAPNHYRTRPLRLFAYAEEGRDALADAYAAAATRMGRDPGLARARAREAPLMIVAACLPQLSNPRVTRQEEEFACAAAIENLLLSLASNDLSSLITTGDLPESREVHELVGIRPEEGRVIAVLDVGYANTERRLPERVVPEPESCISWRDR